MKKAILLTFDFSQRGKSGTGYAAGTLIAACLAHKQYGTDFTIQHLPIKMDSPSKVCESFVISEIEKLLPLSQLSAIAIACYIWSHYLISPLIAKLKKNGFRGRTILGGYQIQKSTCLELYPTADTYIVGYAEKNLPEAILSDVINMRILEDNSSSKYDLSSQPSPYITGVIDVANSKPMVHMETKRGCQFKCNFCQHRDTTRSQLENISPIIIDRVKRELDLFKSKKVKKINFIDPIFNDKTSNYLDILDYCIEIDIQSELCFQVRFEFVDAKFISKCELLNVNLEFGLQTLKKSEWEAIDRPNNLSKVLDAIELLKKHSIKFEVSLIYGLPNQTVATFQESIAYLKSHNVVSVSAFPLMLLEGTKLKLEKDKYGLKEAIIDDSNIPVVVESQTFTKADYREMQKIADELNNPQESL